MTNWAEWKYYPDYSAIPSHLLRVFEAFSSKEEKISTDKDQKMDSNHVLEIVAEGLERIGFVVEHGKKKEEKIKLPVLFGKNGKPVKSFDVDAYNENSKTVIEVEAGRAVTNNQFLKDFFEAIVMTGVDYCVIAVRKSYRENNDFEEVIKFFDTLYSSRRFDSQLKGLLVIGY
ncbi:hypothetical protein M1585_04035 [Candidatus Parvarchaeota archaeon]|nr:hypothetical protein [Candidatus Parvarchaeota archaeon]